MDNPHDPRLDAEGPLGAAPTESVRLETDDDDDFRIDHSASPSPLGAVPRTRGNDVAPTPPGNGRRMFGQRWTEITIEMPPEFLAFARAWAVRHPLRGTDAPCFANTYNYGSAAQAAADLTIWAVYLTLREHPDEFAWETAAEAMIPRFLFDQTPQIDEKARALAQVAIQDTRVTWMDALSAKFKSGRKGTVSWQDIEDAIAEGVDLDDAERD